MNWQHVIVVVAVLILAVRVATMDVVVHVVTGVPLVVMVAEIHVH